MLLALQLNSLLESGGGSDTTPDAFSFTDQTGVARNATITSASVTITGIDAPASFTVTGGTIDRNGDGNFVASGTVNNGDQIRARHASAAAYATATNTVVDIGGVTDTFTSTTLDEPAGGGGDANARARLGGMMVFG